MSIEKAQVVKMSELLSSKIGDNGEDREKSDNELVDALRGKSPDEDPFKLELSDEKAVKDEPSDLESKTQDPNEELSTDEIKTPEVDEKPLIKEETIDLEPQSEASLSQLERSNFYKQTLKLMYGDTITSIVEEDSEGNEVEHEIESIIVDENYFNELVKAKQASIAEEASEGKISTKGVSQFAIDLVDIDRSGGDISELIRTKEAYTDPLNELDLDNEEDQEKAVYLRMMAGGQDHDTSMRLISSYKQEGILEEMARKAEQELSEAMAAQVEQAKEMAKQESEKRKSLVKEYKKEIRTNLDNYQLKDGIKNKIVKLAIQQDEHGRFEMDNLYRKHRENPKDAADLALFLLDKKEFVNQVTNSATEKTKLNTAHKLKIVRTTDKGTQIAQDNTKDAGLGVSISELRNT